ncbi:MAG: hypothetical protein KAS95_02245 [Candidatus Heimdallarchaeota archaeon]|nr:hypothetical protein [Candidatus Heimdallarchaeota archaeon]
MKKLLKSRKGVSNVISTLILFTVMVSSLGLALAQIIPAIENFQTQSNLTAATNNFLNIDAVIKQLVNKPENSSEVVRYGISNGVLDVYTNGNPIMLIIESEGLLIDESNYTMGELVYVLNGNFKEVSGTVYDFGDPQILVNSINRTAQVTNIVHQTLEGQKVLKLSYSVFMNVEYVSDNELEINFILIHLNTSKTADGQGEYFPVINTETKIQVRKQSQVVNSTYLGTYGDFLTIKAQSSDFFQVVDYPLAQASFDLTLNVMHIYIEFRTI